MTSKPPPIPTKNALRALRRLALAGSTAVGAVGSVCGLAFVSYDVRQRIRLAEKIIEHKNIIRSVSSGTGKAHVQRMFDLAEKGEDFGLNVSRREKRRRVRDFSQVAPASVQADDVKSAVDTIASLSRNSRAGQASARNDLHPSKPAALRPEAHDRHSTRSPSTDHSSPASPPRNAPREGETRVKTHPRIPHTAYYSLHLTERSGASAAVRQVGDVGKRLDNRPNSSAAQRIIEATQKQHKLRTHQVYGQPASSTVGARTSLAGCVDEWLAPEGRRDRRARREKTDERRVVEQRHGEEKVPKTTPELPESNGSPTNISFISSFKEWPPASAFVMPSEADAVRNDLVESMPPPRTESEADVSLADTNFSHDLVVLDDSKTAAALQSAGAPVMEPTSQAPDRDVPPTPFDRTQEIQRLLSQINSALSGAAEAIRCREVQASSASLSTPSDVSDLSLESHGIDNLPPDLSDPNADLSGLARPTDANSFNTGTPSPNGRMTESPHGLPDSVGARGTRAGQARGFVTGPLKVREINEAASSFVPIHYSRVSRFADMTLNKARILAAAEALQKGPTDSEYHALVTAIFQTIAPGRLAKAEQFYEAALWIYAQSGTLEDWQRVDGLYTLFFDYFGSRPACGPLRQLARFLFRNSDSFKPLWLPDTASSTTNYGLERAATILFAEAIHSPLESAGTNDQQAWGRRAYRPACQYLSELWAARHDVDEILRELRNVLRAAQHLQLPKSEPLFSTVIGSLASIGEVPKACALADEMAHYHGIAPTTLTKTPLLLGHAIARDWAKVAHEFESMHHQGLSRTEPIECAVMFSTILQEHALQKPLMETYDYAVNALCYWGIIPISQISATIIPLCLQHERYDLVREWVEAMRISFPRVDSGAGTLALPLARTWDQLKASCEQIEQGCKAIIARSDGEDQPVALKIAVRDSVQKILTAKLHAVDLARADLDGPKVPASEYETLNACLERARRLGNVGLSHDNIPDASDLQHVLTEATAVVRLQELFGGKAIPIAHVPRPDEPPVHHPRPRHQPHIGRLGGLQATFPPALTRDRLPPQAEIRSLVDSYYSSRAKENLPTQHVLLRYVCERLIRQIRHDDAYDLIHHVYRSDHVQGPHGLPLDLDLIQLWLQVVYAMKSLSKCLQVLWAVLQMGNELQLTHQFWDQATRVVRSIRDRRSDMLDATQIRELKWLYQTLEQRYAAQLKLKKVPEYRGEDGLLWTGA